MANSTASVPTGMPPPGVTPNPESIAYRVILAVVICPAVTLPFVLMRLYTKRFILKHLHLDDYMIAFSFLLSFTWSILHIFQTKNGLGLHLRDVTLDKYARFQYIGVYCNIAYNVCTFLIKSSILMFYLRLSTLGLRFKITVYGVMFIVIGYSIASSVAPLYLCQPMRKLWDFTIPGKCISLGDDFLANAALNVATDFAIFLLPIWLLSPLTLPLREKIGVTLILMTGSLVVAISVIRLANIPFDLDDSDVTWHFVRNLVWCTIEMYAGIICASLPCLKAFAKHHLPDMFPEHSAPEPVLHGFTGLSNDLPQQLGNEAGYTGESGNTISSQSVSLNDLSNNPSIRTEDQKEEHVFISIVTP
ncbi:hypothetical protein DL95DRAFT_528910 [Leptodontidium sp. 2 PMI_412]|nr:hypothetical protein DL95DRAFT_528910 [Leptodontidium sp. 2 PMI_412]